jgi:hypothetical protein
MTFSSPIFRGTEVQRSNAYAYVQRQEQEGGVRRKQKKTTGIISGIEETDPSRLEK